MIDKQEIIKFSKTWKLQASTVEKDYVLGWILIAIQSHPSASNTWVFKGGTCLKKCHFNLYRFSEDLDFTLTEPICIEEQTLKTILREIGEWVQKEAGIEIPIEKIDLEYHRNLSVQAKIPYLGPLKQQKRPLPNILLDLTASEKIVLPPEKRYIYHPYSDRPKNVPLAACYPYEEIFAEKLRAFRDRMRPRDLYDIIHLYQERHRLPFKVNKRLLLEILRVKCKYKNITVPTWEITQQHPGLSSLASQWENMLAHQVPHLDPYEKFWEELPDLFSWLYEKE
jgi:predicted nucleotidyltransferase component of viral defense system